MVVSNKKKAIIVWLLALLVVVAAAGAAFYVFRSGPVGEDKPNKAELQAKLDEGIKQSLDGMCAEAVLTFDKLLEDSASEQLIDAEAKLRQAQCYTQLKRHQDAAKRYDEASKQYGALGDTVKQGQAKALYEQAAAQSLNEATSSSAPESSDANKVTPDAW